MCGDALQERSREELETELAHVGYLLTQIDHWEPERVDASTRAYLRGRYMLTRQVLTRALERPDAAPALVEVPAEPAPPPEAPVVDALPVDARVIRLHPPVEPQAAPESRAVPSLEPEAYGGEPVFDIPEQDSPERKAVEEASTWHRVWKPFLYESVLWFIGAFLVIAGSFYFVALGWSGMTDVARSLTVFGLAAAYAAAFFGVGSWLCRRPELASAGRVLGLIGAAIAPLAGLSLAPALERSPVLVAALAVGWAAASGALSGSPARRFDVASTRWMQWLFGVTTLAVAIAPAVVRLSTAPQGVWSAALLLVFAHRVARARPDGAERSASELAFAVLAPTALIALYVARLHDTLGGAGAAPPWGVYAPLASAVAMTWLRARSLHGDRAADPISVAVVVAQFGAVVAAAFGPPPSFFLSAAVLTWTTVRLAAGEGKRARWLYPAYAAGYLAYQSVGQLVPAWLDVLLAQVRTALGYAPGARLPFNFAAVYAVPYVAVLALLAVRAVRRDDARARTRGEVLLRATAAASVFFALEAIGGDARPVIWGTPALAVLCLGLGVWLPRLYLIRVGAAVSAMAPVALALSSGLAEAAFVGGAFALVLVALTTFVQVPPRSGVALAAGLLSTLAVVLGWTHALDVSTASTWAVAGVFAGAAAAGLLAWQLRSEAVTAWAGALAIAVLPHLAWTLSPPLVGSALALSALLAAGVSAWLRARWLAAVSVAGAIGAAILEAGMQHDLAPGSGDLLGPVLVAGALTAAIAARALPVAAVASAAFTLVACLPGVPGFEVWPSLAPAASAALYLVLAAGASAWAAVRRRTLATTSFAIAAVVGALLISAYAVIGSSRDAHLVVWLSAAAVFAASRALAAWFCVPVAMTMALAQLGLEGSGGRLTLAVALTGLALLDEVPRLRGWLVSERRIGLLGSVCAALVLTVEASTPEWMGHATPLIQLPHLILASVLGVFWVRATRQGWLLALGLAIAFVSFRLDATRAVLPVIPLAIAVLVTRAVRMSNRAAVLLGVDATGVRVQLEAWTLGAVALGAALVALTPPGRTLPVGVGFPVAVLTMAGTSVGWRWLVLTVALAFVPELRATGPALLLVAGFATVHASARVARLLRAEEETQAPTLAGYGAVGLAILAPVVDPQPAVLALWPAIALAGSVLLSGHVWVIAALGLALGAGLWKGGLVQGPAAEPFAFATSALLFAAASVAVRVRAVRTGFERVLHHLAPPVRQPLDAPLWASAALALGAAIFLLAPASHEVVSTPEWLVLAATLLLLVSTRDHEVAIASALLALTTRMYLGGWGVAVAAVTGALLVAIGRGLAPRLGPGAGVLRRTGCALAVAVPLLLPGLGSPALPWSVLAAVAAVWIAVAGDPRREAFGWAATWAGAHATMLHLGVVYSTGRGPEFILPYLAAISATLGSAVFFLRGTPARAWTARALSAVAFVELGAALLLLQGVASTEAFIAAGAVALLCAAQLTAAQRDGDAVAASLAQGSLLLGYLALRRHAFAFTPLDARDSLAALVAGALFGGLFTWTQREARLHRAFVAPARAGAFLFPLVGLLALPWADPWAAAALLVAHSAHFSVLARGASHRRAASLLAFVAFNAALFFAWRATGFGEPQYYVIPAGIAALVLVRIFRDDLSALAQARVRAAAITAIYAASAWKPLMFNEAWAMIACVLVCVAGVVAGIALRIRSFVYLGSAFLVTSVVANLVRFGVREPRMGALFLSLLGLLVVATMVLFTAKRAELVRRYEAMRALMEDWDR